ncbi:ABC transporter substrate-binding protein [Reichenbachiella versicolor]|uniref:ABC transporter substrate-binding protein n=1 Tax=Reichenbachiella versicolor TaxID=1821036 RepID=UPI000D6E9021|nr:ABC transporter substrate-binding protein [Reichenbachiella versicolor]
MRTIRFDLLFLLLLISRLAVSQTPQKDYLQAKQFFAEENYKFAAEFFKKAAREDSPFKNYALYYLGLSSYKNNEIGFARSTWKQIEAKNPKWKQIREVYFWLAQVYFDEGDYSKGVVYAKKSKLPESNDLISHSLDSTVSSQILENLYHQFPDDLSVAKTLAKRILIKPNSQRDYYLLNTIVQKFDLDRTKYGLPDIGDSSIKKTYKVAVILPFFFSGLDNPSMTIRNKFVMDLYEGIKWSAKNQNEAKNELIQIFPYDTKRNADETKALLEDEELKSMDLIIGPLFEKPFKVVSDFAYENKINIIHPLSTNSNVVEANPYAFLFRSSLESQAKKVAEVVANDSLINKNAWVFYENNPKDSLSAAVYSQRIQELGFNVLKYEGVVDTTVRASYDLLIETFELEYLEYQADSIKKADSQRVIKERKSTEEKGEMVYYEEFFKIAPDSIGHIFVASSKPLYASNYISAVEIRNDSTKIIGRGNWLGFETLTFEEMERLDVRLIDIDYCDKTSKSYKKASSEFLRMYHRPISKNVLLGYELMSVFGELLEKYGTYFQNGTAEYGLRNGVFFEGVDYTLTNNNQYVPILRIRNAKVEVINSIDND